MKMKRLLHKWEGYIYILPALIFMFVFIFYPIIYNLILSFQDVTVTTLLAPHKDFVGLENYIDILKQEEFWNALFLNCVFTVVCIFFQFVGGFALAMVFKKETSFFRVTKALMLIPYIIPVTVNAILWKFFFATNGGFINEILVGMGWLEEGIEWLQHPWTAMFSVIVANIWCGIPFFMILLSTGLANIPMDFYESARIDGATAIQQFIYITVPSVKASIQASLILGIVYTFRAFELIYVMTGGGPVNGTELLTLYSYKNSFTKFDFSVGATISNILMLLLLVVGVFYIRMMKDDEEM
nr:sugar ABC transporter permease [uncultured Blautia sp.]